MIYDQEENSLLRARFTKWLEITLYRAKIDYLRKKEVEQKLLYFDEVGYEITDDIIIEREIIEQSAIDFTLDFLEYAFGLLSDVQKEIITLIYLNELKPIEIAHILGCSVPQVYKQRKKALEILKSVISNKDGEQNE